MKAVIIALLLFMSPMGPQQGRKVFMLQALAGMDEPFSDTAVRWLPLFYLNK